jgi:predicted DNA-binding transcriptional regulator AlpA
MHTISEDDLLTTEEVAAWVRKPVGTMRWLRATGQGPRSAKLGRRVVYRRSDVEAWVAAAFEGEA